MSDQHMSPPEEEAEGSWISVSDLMAGLMMVFLLLFIVFSKTEEFTARHLKEELEATQVELTLARENLEEARRERDAARQRQVALQRKLTELQWTLFGLRESLGDAADVIGQLRGVEAALASDLQALVSDLRGKFEDRKEEWSATIDGGSLTIRFEDENTLFDSQASQVKDDFKEVLKEFFPQYIALLYSHDFRDEIAEIRIEGHTSSPWKSEPSKWEAFKQNMKLSQDRSREVFNFVVDFEQKKDDEDKNEMIRRVARAAMARGVEGQDSEVVRGDLEQWLSKRITANGLSSINLILDSETGKEDEAASRRVEFAIRTKSQDELYKTFRDFENSPLLRRSTTEEGGQ